MVLQLSRFANATLTEALEDMRTLQRTVKGNIVTLNIFYKELSYYFMEEHPTYDTTSLLTDIGGIQIIDE